MSKLEKAIIGLFIVLIIAFIIFLVLFLKNDEGIDEVEDLTKEDSASYNLNDYNKDLTITKGGTFDITGSFAHSIIINTEENVTLNLNNVTIESDTTAGIINKGRGTLTLYLMENSVNNIKDNGTSIYDAAIYSVNDLIIEGSGVLYVEGNQKEGEGIATEEADITINSGTIKIKSNDDGLNAGGDKGGIITINGGNLYIDAGGDGIDSNNQAIINGGVIFVMGSSTGGDAGIDTDNGYKINGGTVVALGSDMLETPDKDSKQNTLSLSLDSKIKSGTNVTLINKENEEIISFQASKDFKTIIISTSTLVNDTYQILTNTIHSGTLNNGIYEDGEYREGTLLKVNNASSFEVSSIVNNYGNNAPGRP